MNLAFYSACWQSVSAIVGSRQKRFLRTILQGPARHILDDLAAAPEECQEFEDALEAWINGEVHGEKHGDRTIIESIPEALAFSALLQSAGQLIGVLDHTISSGSLFRDEFIRKVATQALAPPFRMDFLVSRPILGRESDDLPCWGGLSKDEISELRPRLNENAPDYPQDPDIEKWLGELWLLLGSASDLNRDLITVYA